MKWRIVCDSSCDLKEYAGDGFSYASVPFIISIGSRDFVDDDTIAVDNMVCCMEKETGVAHTSCPSPGLWHEEFVKADRVIAVTISKELSGSYNSAMTAREIALEEDPGRKIAVIDTLATGPNAVMLVQALSGMIGSGMDFEEVVAEAEKLVKEMKIVFTLCSFDNLVKNGRMNRITGFLAEKLRMWGIGIGDPNGRIEIIGKARGLKKMFAQVLQDMERRRSSVRKVVISHCGNADAAEALGQSIREKWADAAVEILQTRGLNSFYAERGGLIIGYV